MGTDNNPPSTAERLPNPKRPTRTHMIRVRVSQTEYDALSTKAKTAGLSVSAFLRDHAGKAFIRNRDDERQRRALVNRLNANLNMIARWANTYKSDAEAATAGVFLSDIRREFKLLLHRWDMLS
jgi:hypothetical protein